MSEQEIIKHSGVTSFPTGTAQAQLVLEAQAEISFKAGVKVGYSAGIVDGQYTNHKRHGKKMVQARLEGRKEVVEWLKENMDEVHAYAKHSPFNEPIKVVGKAKWQAKLKEWGIE